MLALFLKSLWWVVSRVVGLLTLMGIIGGLNADIPGIADEPLAQQTIAFCAAVLGNALRLLRSHPDGVLLGLCALAIARAYFVSVGIGNQKKTFDSQRTRARDRHRKPPPPGGGKRRK